MAPLPDTYGPPQINHLKWNLNSLHRAPQPESLRCLGPNPSSGPPFLLPAVQSLPPPHQRLELGSPPPAPLVQALSHCWPGWLPASTRLPLFPFLPCSPSYPELPAHPPGPSEVRHGTMTLSGWKLGAPITICTTSVTHRPASPFTINPSSSLPPGSQVRPDTSPCGPSAFSCPTPSCRSQPSCPFFRIQASPHVTYESRPQVFHHTAPTPSPSEHSAAPRTIFPHIVSPPSGSSKRAKICIPAVYC